MSNPHDPKEVFVVEMVAWGICMALLVTMLVAGVAGMVKVKVQNERGDNLKHPRILETVDP